MLSYLSAEANFVRAFGNRTLFLIFLCALTRTVPDKPASASAFGLSINLNPGIIAVYGPLLVLLLLVGLRTESDILHVSREAVLAEAGKLPVRVRRVNRAIYGLFWMPTIAAIYMILQYYFNVVPDTPVGCDYERKRQFFETNFLSGSPSMYCIRDIKEGMPWIYMPFQIYIYLGILAGCSYLTWKIIKSWPKALCFNVNVISDIN